MTHRNPPKELTALGVRDAWSNLRTWTHGSRSTYVAGCRCKDCREASRAYQAHYRLSTRNAQAVEKTSPRQVTRSPQETSTTVTQKGRSQSNSEVAPSLRSARQESH